jgi:hypothetical protein
MKQNCWEFKKCEHKTSCPAFTEKRANGIHGGMNGGRACWAIAGTYCGGEIQGEYAQKLADCIECDFYKKVQREEGINFMSGGKILEIIQSKA